MHRGAPRRFEDEAKIKKDAAAIDRSDTEGGAGKDTF
jgi:hypothetical protein